MATYTDIKGKLDEIANKTIRYKGIISTARANLVDAQTKLAAMPSTYSGLSSDIDQAAIDNPTDDKYLLAKNEKDELSSDFLALKSYVDDLIVAFDGV